MKKINLKSTLLIIIISCPLITSCSKEDNEPRLSFPPEIETLIANGITFPAEGGEQTLVFTPVNQTWWKSWIDTNDNSNWCTVEYKYNFELSKEVEANIHAIENNEHKERCAKLTLKVGDTKKEIIIKQKEKIDYLQLSEEQFKFNHRCSNIWVEVNSNCDYSIDINQEDKSWIWDTAGDIQYHRGNQTITFFMDDNNTTSSRECEITFKGENISEKIKVYQAANPALNASKDGTKAQVEITEAGELPNIISTIDITKIEELTLKGYINGTDFKTIYKMNNLTKLDLSSVNIVAGGEPYYENYYTSKNYISDYLFRGLKATSIVLPPNITYIGYSAFRGSLITSITIPNTVERIGKEAFMDCKGLISITIPNSVRYIGEFAFYNCSNLSAISLPNALTTIKNYTFLVCSKLSCITIPESVNTIETHAFTDGAIKEVHIKSKNVPTYHIAFVRQRFNLYVPKGCKNEYAVSEWASYAIEIIEE